MIFFKFLMLYRLHSVHVELYVKRHDPNMAIFHQNPKNRLGVENRSCQLEDIEGVNIASAGETG